MAKDIDTQAEQDEEWMGLTEEVLSTEDWFDRWLSGEKKCMLACMARVWRF